MPKQKPLLKKLANAKNQHASSSAAAVSRFDLGKGRGQSARVHVARRRGEALEARGEALRGAMRQSATRNVFVRGGKASLFSLADDESVAHSGTLSVRAPGESMLAIDDDNFNPNDNHDNDNLNSSVPRHQRQQSRVDRAVERGKLLKAAKRELKASQNDQLLQLNAQLDAVGFGQKKKHKQQQNDRRRRGDDGDDEYGAMLNDLRDAPRGRPTVVLAQDGAAGVSRKNKHDNPRKQHTTTINEADADAEVVTKRLEKASQPLIHMNLGDNHDDEGDDAAVGDADDQFDENDSSNESDDGQLIAERRLASLKQRASLVVPESVEAFEAQVRGKSPAHVVAECMRILKCNDNVQLEHFFEVLLGFYCRAAKRRPAPLALLNVLVAPLSVLTNSHSNVATRACRALVRDMTPGAALHELEQVDMRTLDAESASALRRHAAKQFVQRRSRMPTLPQLLTMRLQLELWPASAARHGVLTPLSLRLAQSMTLARLTTRGDLYRAFFCIALFKPFVRDERRWAAEPVTLLTALLTTLLEFDDPNDPDIDKIGIRRAASPVSTTLLRIDDADERAALQPQPLSLPSLARALDGSDGGDEDAAPSAQEQVDFVRHALVELAFFVELYADLVALPEVLLRTSTLLEALPDAPLLPEACVPLAAAVAHALRDATLRVTQTRVPMAMQAKLAAKVTSALVSRDILINDPRADDPRERTRKLRQAVRREEKGAMRELRRDAFFMADERHRRWLAEREAIDKREREILGMLARQQGEINILDHIKKGKQPRAGVGKDFNAAN